MDRELIKVLTEENKRNHDLLYLIAKNVVFLHSKENDEIGIYISCTNFFTEDFCGVDFVEIETDEIDVVANIYSNYGFDGIVAFCSHKKGLLSVTSLCHDDFFSVFSILRDRYFYA